jgi:hypothetical protein
MRTPNGWKLILTDSQGTVRGTIDLGDTDLSKPLARAELMNEIKDAVADALPQVVEEEQERTLRAASKKLTDQVPGPHRNKRTCPECGDEGPHDDNGAPRHAELSFCCRKCGTHFDAER